MKTTIEGIVEYCYNGIPVIRGYCSYKTLIKYSKPHEAYQRLVDKAHTTEIKEFLAGTSGYHFMPEVILSYNYSGLFSDAFESLNKEVNYYDPLQYLLQSNDNGKIQLTDKNTKINFRKIKLNSDKIKMLMLELPNLNGLISVPPIPFHRIDGNHRLEALNELDKEDFTIPFCIILLSDQSSSGIQGREQGEMEIFHNINSKSKPLLPIEQYNGLFNLFTVDELKKFGEDLSITKQYKEKHKNLRLSNLSNIIQNIDEVVLESIRFLHNKETMADADDIADILSKLEHTYFNDYVELRECKHQSALVPFIYYCFIEGKQKNAKLDAYTTWFIKNKLNGVHNIDPQSFISIFDSIYDIRKKQIFVAMPFTDELNFVFTAINDVVSKINRENNLTLLPPVRIDKQVVGFSYDIVEEILDNIKNAGLLIADLTHQNANVYYEAGYAQGLIRAKLGNTAQILYLISNPSNPDQPFAENNAKFDVQHYKMIPYKNAGNGVDELKKSIEKELKSFYGI